MTKSKFTTQLRIPGIVAYVTHIISPDDKKVALYKFYGLNDVLLHIERVPIMHYTHNETLVRKSDLPVEIRKLTE